MINNVLERVDDGIFLTRFALSNVGLVQRFF